MPPARTVPNASGKSKRGALGTNVEPPSSAMPPAPAISKEEAEAARLAMVQLQQAEIERQRILYQEQEERRMMLSAEVDSAWTQIASNGGIMNGFRLRIVSALWLGVVCDCPRSTGGPMQWGFHGATVLCVVVSVLLEAKGLDFDGIHGGFSSLFLQWYRHGLLSASGQPSSISTYEALEIAQLQRAPDPSIDTLPHDTLLSRALTLVLLHAQAPRRAMDLAMATVQTSPIETQDVVRYLSMLVLGSVQHAKKDALLRPYMVAHGFSSDFWTTHQPSAPVRRVLSLLPHIQVPTGYHPNAHVVTSFQVILSLFGAATSIPNGLQLLHEGYFSPHTAVGSTVGILLGAHFGADIPSDPRAFILADQSMALADLVHVIFQHGYVYALRAKETASTATPQPPSQAGRRTSLSGAATSVFDTVWSLYAASCKPSHIIATRATATVQEVDPCAIDEASSIDATPPPSFKNPEEMAAEVAEFWAAYNDRVATLVPPPPPPVVMPPPLQATTTSNALAGELKADAVGSSAVQEDSGKAKKPGAKAAGGKVSPGRGSPTPSRQAKANTKKSKKALIPTPDEIARQELRVALSDRYSRVRQSTQTHFEAILAKCTSQVDAAFQRANAVQTWATRSTIATALLSNQHQLQQLHAKLDADGQHGHHHVSKATVSDMCKFSNLMTIKTNVFQPDAIHDMYF